MIAMEETEFRPMERRPMERRRLACTEREARIWHSSLSRLRRSVQASRLRSIDPPAPPKGRGASRTFLKIHWRFRRVGFIVSKTRLNPSK